jgi:hypothetical protein
MRMPAFAVAIGSGERARLPEWGVAVEDVWTDTGEPSPKLLAAERSRRR